MVHACGPGGARAEWCGGGLGGGAGQTGAAGRGAAGARAVKAGGDEAVRTAHAERTFAGAAAVEDLAAAVVGLFSRPAGDLNGRRLLLAP